jgi:hypothetical protein
MAPRHRQTGWQGSLGCKAAIFRTLHERAKTEPERRPISNPAFKKSGSKGNKSYRAAGFLLCEWLRFGSYANAELGS